RGAGAADAAVPIGAGRAFSERRGGRLRAGRGGGRPFRAAGPPVAPKREVRTAAGGAVTTTSPVAPAPPTGRPGSTLSGLIRAVRPRQWVKNTLVLAVPLASADLVHTTVWTKIGLAFAAFCLA